MGSTIEQFLREQQGKKPPTDSTPGNEISDWLASSDTTLKLRSSVDSLKTHDQAARVLRLQGATGLPRDLIERNIDAVEAEAKRADFNPERFRTGSPRVAAWLAEDPNHLSLAGEDLTKLSYMERQFGNIAAQFEEGKAVVELSKLGEKAFLGTITPAERVRQEELEAKQGQAQLDYGLTGFFEGIPGAMANQTPILARTLFGKVKGAVAGAIGGAIGGAAAGAGAAAVAGQLGPQIATPEEAVTVPAGALAGAVQGSRRAALVGWRLGAAVEAARMEGSLAYLEFEKLRDEDGWHLERETAMGAAIIVGAVNGALEGLIGLENLQGIPGLRSLGRSNLKRALMQQTTRQAILRYAKIIGQTAVSEGVTEVMQSLVSNIGGEIATMMQDGSLGQTSTGALLDRFFSEENLAQAAAEGKMGMQAGGGITAATGTLGLAADVKRAKQGQESKRFFEAIGGAVAENKMQEALPRKLEEVVERLTADGPVEHVYAPIEVWNEFWNKQQVDPAEAAEEVLGSRDAYEEAMQSGSDLIIPTSRYATTIAASPHNGFWSKELRLAPDALNAREAEALIKKLDTQSEAQQTEAEAGAEEISEDVVKQLVESGTDESTAKTYATVYEAAFKTLAQRSGIDPRQLYARYKLRISKTEEPTESQEFEQRDQPERIVRAAIKWEEEIIEGSSHPDALDNLEGVLERKLADLEAENLETGFITSQGRFVDPDEAGLIARQSGQFKGEGGLSSEDVGDDLADDQVFEQTDLPLGMHSKAERLIEKKMQKGATADQVNDILKPIKQEERQWLEIDEFLKTKEKFTKDEVLEYLHANRLQIDEAVSPDPTMNEDAIEDIALERVHEEVEIAIANLLTRPRRGIEFEKDGEFWFVFSTPYIGGGRFNLNSLDRELIATIPTAEEGPVGPFDTKADAIGAAREQMRDSFVYSDLYDSMVAREVERIQEDGAAASYSNYTLSGAGDTYQERRLILSNAKIGEDAPFRSSHWSEANVLAHVRSTIRQLQGGEVSLHLEEVQSDWHQRGRRKGYKTPEFRQQLAQAKRDEVEARGDLNMFIAEMNLKYEDEVAQEDRERISPIWVMTPEELERRKALEQAVRATMDRRQDLEVAETKATPDAPLKKTWHEFVIKRMIAEAVAQGLDGLSWNPGAVLADIFSLSTAGVVRLRFFPNSQILQAFDANGDTIVDADIDFDENTLEDYVGADLAKQLLEQPLNKNPHAGVGPRDDHYDLTLDETTTIGGEGMKGFYDEILVRYLNKFGKQFGTKVTTAKTEITSARNRLIQSGVVDVAEQWEDTEEADVQRKPIRANIHYLPFTPELVKAAQAGDFEAFQASRPESGMKKLALKELQDELDIIEWEQAHAEEMQEPDYGQPIEDDELAEQAAGLAGRAAKLNQMIELITKGQEGAAWDVLHSATSMEDLNYLAEIAPNALTWIRQVGFPQDEEGEGAPRGRIKIGQSGVNIELLERANLSTFIHETGHLYMYVLEDLATAKDADANIKRDYELIRQWAGLGDDEMMLDSKEAHEKFARGFEAYLMEGRAPTTALRQAFGRFRAWLIMVYRSLTNLDVQLTDEVRGVFDRLLAGDDEIAAASKDLSIAPLFEDPESIGMSETQAAEYRAAVEKARMSAHDYLSTKLLDDVRKEQTRQWKTLREKVRADVVARVNQDRVARARAILTRGKLPDGSDLPPNVKAFKLNGAAIHQWFEPEVIKKLPRPYVYSKEGGIHHDSAADLLGFSSGHELVKALIASEDPRVMIERLTDEEMKKEHGDLFTDGQLPVEALKAVHLPDRAEVMHRELKHLASEQLGTMKNLTRKISRRIPPIEAVREQAQQTIQGKKVRDIRPIVYQRGEAKAAKGAMEAFLAGDLELAFEEKQRELLNYELYRAAVDAKDRVEKIVGHMAKFSTDRVRRKLGKAGGDYLAQIDGIRDRFDFAKVSLVELEKRRALEEFVAEHADYLPKIPPRLLDDAYKINYKDMTFSELEAVEATVSQIEHFARLKNRLLANKKQRETQAAEAEIIGAITAHHELKLEPLDIDPGFGSRIKAGLRGFHAAHSKAEFIFEWLDGNENLGPAWRYLFKPIAEAEDNENIKMREAATQLRDIFSVYSKEERARWYLTKHHIPLLDTSFTKASLLTLALNWGNQYNRDAVLRGYKNRGWTEAGVQQALAQLDKRDWDTVQKVWDYLDTYWPEISALEKELNGIAPEKVEATPVQTKFGEYQGGYYPIVFDSKLSWRQAALDAAQSTKDIFGGQWASLMTRHGHTKERNDTGGKPVNLQLSGLTNHVSQVIHDLTHRRAVIDVANLLQRPAIRESIESSIGTEQYRQLRPWLAHVAAEQRGDHLNPIEGLFGAVRAGGTVVSMGWKFTTAVAQIFGFTGSVKELGAKYATAGMRDTWGNPFKLRQKYNFVTARSEFMRDRISNYDRDVHDALKKLNVAGVHAGPLSIMQPYTRGLSESWFLMIGWMDMGVSLPTWMGAYAKAMDGKAKGVPKGDEHSAIDYADKIVRQTQGVGSPKDLATVQRGPEAFKLFTMFYSYFSVLYNQFAKTQHEFQQDKNVPKLIASLALLWFLPAVLSEIVVGRGPDDDEDDLKWTLKTALHYPFSSMILVRDVVNGMDQWGYSPSAALQAFDALSKAGRATAELATEEDRELRRTDVKNAVMVAGYFAKLPSRQLWITGEYFYDWMQDNTEPTSLADAVWRATLTGTPEE